MTDNDGPSDDATQPVRLHKDEQAAGTERIPTTPETQRFERTSAPSSYYTPPGQYSPEPPAQPHPQYPVQQQLHQPPAPPMQSYGPPRPMAPPAAYNSTVVATGRPPASGALIAVAWILAVVTFFYLLPWAIAATRNKSNHGAIFLLNFFLGWSFIGWVIALVMACGTDPQSNVVVVNQSTSQHYYR